MVYNTNKKKSNTIYLVFFVLLLIELFLPAIMAYMSNAIVFFYFLYKNKGKLISPFRSMRCLYWIVVLGAVIGLFSLVSGRFETRDYIRDLYYFTNPILVILNGANFYKNIKDDNRFFNTIVSAAGIQAVYYLLHALTIIANRGLDLSFRSWRLIFGDSNAVVASAIVFILIDRKNELISLKKNIRVLVLILCILEIIVSLSRTNILLILITLLVVGVQRGSFRNIKKWLKYIALGIIIFIISVVILGKTVAVTTFIDKIGDSFTEINNALDWSNVAVIQGNWRGYETHMAITQFSKYPVWRQLIGYGFGERIEVGIYAYNFLDIVNSDGSRATTIPVLHNGYSTMLCKLGIFGIILYATFYISLIIYGRKKRKYRPYSEILIAIVIAMAVETYILNGLFRENINYPYIYLIGYLGCSIKSKELQHVFDGNNKTVFAGKKMEIG